MAKRIEKPASGDSDFHRKRKTFFQGIPVVPGIALGTVRLKFRRTQVMSDRTLSKVDAVRDLARFDQAVKRAQAQLEEDKA